MGLISLRPDKLSDICSLRRLDTEGTSTMRLSKFSYYIDFFISGALVAALAGTSLTADRWMQDTVWALYVIAGALCWSLLEYVVHRWLYHRAPYFRDLHHAHHAEPNAFIGAPPIVGILLILAIFFAPFVTTSMVAASGLTTGILIGYMSYMLVHHAAHYWKLSPVSWPSSWLWHARRHHALHHHHAIECNYGITTSLWDHVFGTAYSGRSRAFAPQLP